MTETREPPAQPGTPSGTASKAETATPQTAADPGKREQKAAQRVPEIGGPTGPEPTRYGDWEREGRCVDF